MTISLLKFGNVFIQVLTPSLHLSFVCLSQGKLSFGYDLEHVIDDWVLMGFLVGNDFLPHLPNMHIKQVKGRI